MRNPTQKEKIAKYEQFLHDINLYVTTGRPDLVTQLVNNADMWSYAHRFGNGSLSEKEQQEAVNRKFHKLCEIIE